MYTDDEIMDFDKTSGLERKKRRKSQQGSGKKRDDYMERKPAKRRNPLAPFTIAMCLITVGSLSVSILLALGAYTQRKMEREEAAYMESMSSQEVTITLDELDAMKQAAYDQGAADKKDEIYDYVKDYMSQPGAGSMALFWEMYPEYVIYNTSGGYVFEPINHDIPELQINRDNLTVCENGEVKLYENGVDAGHLGIDVSSYQGDIAWDEVAGAGVEYAYIRAGYRGYGTGKLVADEKADVNINGALSNGINTGVYFFSQAISEAEIDEEIQMLLDAVAPYDNYSGPFIIDVEKVEDSTARGNQLSKEERTQLVLYFCNRVRELGYEPVIYGNLNSMFNMLDSSKVATETVWYAYYSDYLYYPYKLHGWQYTCTFSIPGITGDVDASIIF